MQKPEGFVGFLLPLIGPGSSENVIGPAGHMSMAGKNNVPEQSIKP